MNSKKNSLYNSTHRTIRLYLGTLLGIVFVFGILHYLFADLKVENISWFNLDKERNFPTWFSGMLFFLFGIAALVAYYWERRINIQGQSLFHLPILWLGVGFAGLFMSLDEITILHENILWREVRQTTDQLSDTWIYVTQWQVLFAPAIVLLFCYFILFFSNRFRISPLALRAALTGLGLWATGLLLEGVRGTFKQAGDVWYSSEVIAEELIEMAGATFLLASLTFYIMDISLNLTQERRQQLTFASNFFTRRAVTRLGGVFLVLLVIGFTIFFFARKQAKLGAPTPKLHKWATKEISTHEEMTDSSSLIPVIESGEIWFDNIMHTKPLSESDAKSLTKFVSKAIFNPEITEDGIPENLITDRTPRIVFISLSDGASTARVVRGSGKNIGEATEKSLLQVRKLIKDGYQPQWIKLDVVQAVSLFSDIRPGTSLKFDRSLYGLAFDRDAGLTFLPEELVSYSLLKKNALNIRFKKIDKYLKENSILTEHLQRLRLSKAITLYRFSTKSFFSDGGKIIQLYRGHRLFKQPSPDDMLAAAIAGGQYLTTAVEPDGRFVYSYSTKASKVSKKYNILRHTGTIYSMLELYEVTHEEALLNSAKRAIDYLLASTLPCQLPSSGSVVCVIEDDEAKLGGNALAVIALIKYIELTEDKQYLPKLITLGQMIQAMQKENGKFIHKITYPEGKDTGFISQYYPGEAILAMTRIYGLDPDKSWLDTAENGAKYLINVRDKGLSVPELTHDHWLLYGLNELYRYRKNQLYLDHAMRIAQAIMLRQNQSPKYPDWLGSYYRPPRSTPTATRTEGLCAAFELARDFGAPVDAEKILQAIKLGIAFQLQTQFRPESAMYVRDPQRSLGGFHRSLTNLEIRIDYVQHNISSLLYASRILQSLVKAAD